MLIHYTTQTPPREICAPTPIPRAALSRQWDYREIRGALVVKARSRKPKRLNKIHRLNPKNGVQIVYPKTKNVFTQEWHFYQVASSATCMVFSRFVCLAPATTIAVRCTMGKRWGHFITFSGVLLISYKHDFLTPSLEFIELVVGVWRGVNKRLYSRQKPVLAWREASSLQQEALDLEQEAGG